MHRPHKRHHYYFTVKEKINIVWETKEGKYSQRYMARKYKVHESSICHWIKNFSRMIAKGGVNPTAETSHHGREVFYGPVESEVKNWIDEMCDQDIISQTEDVINKAHAIARKNNYDFFPISMFQMSLLLLSFIIKSNIVNCDSVLNST
jgi:transposase-like protein